MDATNLATLFAPNLLHNFGYSEEMSAATGVSAGGIAKGVATVGEKLPAATSATAAQPVADRMDCISAIRILIEKKDVIFELQVEEFHDMYLYLHENFPDLLDALLRKRAALAGEE